MPLLSPPPHTNTKITFECLQTDTKMFEFHRLTRPGNEGIAMCYVRLSFEIAMDRWHCHPVMKISNSNRTRNRYVFIGCEEIFKRCSLCGWMEAGKILEISQFSVAVFFLPKVFCV